MGVDEEVVLEVDRGSFADRLNDALGRVKMAERILHETRESLADLVTEDRAVQQQVAQRAARKMTGHSLVPVDADTGVEVQGDEDNDASAQEKPFGSFSKLAAKRSKSFATPQDAEDAEEKEVSQAVEVEGCSQRKVLKYLRKEKEEQDACLQLPGATLLMVVFALMSNWHLSLHRAHAVDQAHWFDITENANFAFSGITPFENGRMGHKTIYDVNSIPDVWSFFTLGLVPLWWPDQSSFGVSEMRANIASACTSPRDSLEFNGWNSSRLENVSTSPIVYGAGGLGCPAGTDRIVYPRHVTDMKIVGSDPDLTATYLYFNSIVAGVRLTQDVRDTHECPSLSNDRLRALHSGACVHGDPWWLFPEKYSGFAVENHFSKSRESQAVYLKSRESQASILAQLRELEDMNWFNPMTSKLEILFTSYNAHEELLTATFIFIFVNPAGHFHKMVEPVSIWLDPYHQHDPFVYVFDLIWIVLVLKMFAEEAVELGKHIYLLGFRQGLWDYFDFMNIVDWVSIVHSATLVILWIWHLMQVQKIQGIMEKADASTIGSFAKDDDRVDYFDAVHETVHHQYVFRAVLACYPFVIVTRFFKAFNQQPRLSMVTQTLSKAWVDIVHFAMVFFTAMVVFAISGNLLFGEELVYFSNFARSFHSTFRILIGDFDWELLHRVGRPQAYLWFWALQWLLCMVMLNMLLAIIMDVYSEVRTHILNMPHVETVWSQAAEIWARKRQVYSGNFVSLSKILMILDPQADVDSDDDEKEEVQLSVDSFLLKVPNLGRKQAIEIMTQAEVLDRYMVEKSKPDISTRNNDKLNDLYDVVEDILAKVENIRSTLRP
jgi:hypothetical protein